MPSRAIQLDTNFLIRSLVPGSDPDQALRMWLSDGHPIAMSSIAWTEFLCRPLDPEHRDLAMRILSERIAFDEADAAFSAQFFNATGRRRGSLIDCMIAASAVRRGAPLATLNMDDFRRFESLGLVLATAANP